MLQTQNLSSPSLRSYKGVQDFLKKHSYDKSKHPFITNTRIGDTNNGIFGGSYYISDEEYPEFLELYYQEIVRKGKCEYLTEKQLSNHAPILVDLDLRFDKAVKSRQYTQEHITNIVDAYLVQLKTIFQFDEDTKFEIFVLEKNRVNCLEDKTKDGLHLIISIQTDRCTQILLREKMLTPIAEIFSNIPITNNAADILDDGISIGHTNWQLFGSSKPKHETYFLTQVYNITFDPVDGEFMIDNIDIKTYDIEENFKKLTARSVPECCLFFNSKFQKDHEEASNPKKKSKSFAPVLQLELTNDLSTLTNLAKCWKAERIDKSSDWFQLGWAIANTFGKSKEVEDIFVGLNDRVPSRNSITEKEKAKEWFQDKCETRNGDDVVGIGSLKKWAKDDNEILYAELFIKPNLLKNQNLEDLFKKEYSTGRFAEYFTKEYDTKFISVDGSIYHFTGVYWQKDDQRNSVLHKFIDNTVYNVINGFVDNQVDDINKQKKSLNQDDPKFSEKDKNLENELKKWLLHRKNLNKIREHSSRKLLIEDIIIALKKQITLDKNPYLFAFENKVFDLKSNQFIKPEPADYLTLSCGWEYDNTYDLVKNTIELEKIINQIFPSKEVGNYYLEALSTGLFGQQVEHLFIATGEGGNGKSLINSLAMNTYGTYGYKLPSSTLLGEIKAGANPQMANLHQKRAVLTQEPDARKRINSSTLKELTGDSTLNVRDNYSSMCKTILYNSMFLEANDLPLLNKIDAAITRRIRTIPFISSFVDQTLYDSLEDKTNIFVGNSYYKSDEFQTQYKQALFHILTDKFQIYKNNNNSMSVMPNDCYEAGKKYYMMSDDFITWFYDNYEKDESEYVYVSDIFNYFKLSSAYNDLSKQDKRKFTKSGFDETIQKNMFLKPYYKPRDTSFNKEKLNKPFISGYKQIQPDNDIVIIT